MNDQKSRKKDESGHYMDIAEDALDSQLSNLSKDQDKRDEDADADDANESDGDFLDYL